MAVKTEMKPLPAFLLKVDKATATMKQAASPDADPDCRFQASGPPLPNTPSPPTITFRCSNMTMEHFSKQLRDFAWANINRPVVDITGLKGAWDFDLRFSWQQGAPDAITIFQAVAKLGLKLEAGTAPRPAIDILSMAESPTPNTAGIAKRLPPAPPPSFEVAVIRPQDGSKPVPGGLRGNQWTTSATQLGLISMAWDISVKTIVNAPPFMDRQVWVITAKLPIPDTPPMPGKRVQIDGDQVPLMIRSLLAERFGLKTHIEDRLGSDYTLRAGTLKLKNADPPHRASCTAAPPQGEKNPRLANPLLTQYMHCDNVTMDEFARELQGYSGYVIKTPVLNAPGIEGRYDLTLTFTGLHALENLAAGGSSEGTSSDAPAGVPLTLEDAVAKQLGLKLELARRPIASLVIDHIDEKPTEN
jgi:uncharacterized protein (TIGR03435 family)